MPTIEQVSKRLFSDSEWLKKWVIGSFLLLFVITSFFSFGYLYRLLAQGRNEEEFALPQWSMDEWKRLLVDGLICFLIFLVFAWLPVALVWGIIWQLPGSSFLARLPLIPVVFLAGPFATAALYLYQVRKDLKDCFNFTALGHMLSRGATSYAPVTLAFVGLLALGGWTLFAFVFFFGGVIYMYMMGRIYRSLEVGSQA